MDSNRLRDLVTVRGRFHRSVSLTRDWAGGRDFSEYIVTPALQSIGEQIVEELGASGGTRSWSLTGPYGTGKSAFSLFLADVLSAEKPALPEGKQLRKALGRGVKPFVPVLVQAERGELLPLIVEAIEREARAIRSPVSRKAKKLSEGGKYSGEAVADLLSEFADSAAKKKKGGVALFVDEFGKFLEYASADTARGDVFALQQLAEAASRSEVPILFVTILHSGFADYLSGGDDVRRAEWQKVQGRFRDVPFQLPTDQLISLISHAIETKFDTPTEAAYEAKLDSILMAEDLAQAFDRDGLRDLLRQCAPLHPVTALLLWPLFRSKVAQNERSLFAFLTSHEPFGFQEFLVREVASSEETPLFGLPELYDYILGALGVSTFTGTDARKWTLIDHALSRVPAAAPAIARDVIKTVGLLAQYGQAVGLKPSQDTLAEILSDGGLHDALDFLTRESILVYRRHSNSYGLWEGSDLDLEDAFENARIQVSGRPLYERFERIFELSPIVARAHYVESGTLRFFDSGFAPADSRAIHSVLETESISDGSIVFLVGAGEIDSDLARDASAAASDDRPTLVALPRLGGELAQALEKFECWEWIADNVPELQGDPVARQEVRARLQAARSELDRLAGPIFGLSGHALDPGQSEWFANGKPPRKELASPRDLQQFLSKVCSDTFSEAPKLQNELLNRHNLSSAAARARRNLLERMLHNADEEQLGIEGFPPEFSMYCAMLEQGGMHSSSRGRWRLKAPSKSSGWLPAWAAVEAFLKSATSARRPLVELFETLRAAPLGLRDGPIPVLVTCALIVKGDEIAVYEDGVFVPTVTIEMVERLLRRPETFEIQSYRLKPAEKRVLEALRGALDLPDDEADAALVTVVRGLIRVAAALPPYTRQTRALSEATCDVRDALLSATDPKDLVFRELPELIGIEIKNAGSSQDVAEALTEHLHALTRAYPAMLDRVGDAIRQKFGLPDDPKKARAELQKRAEPVVGFVSEERLQVFVREAARLDDRDWREVLGRAINDGKPPGYWRDHDLESVHSRLEGMASDFARAESLVAQMGHSANRVVSFSILDPTAGERRADVTCTDQLESAAMPVVEAIEQILDQSSSSREAVLVALLDVADRIYRQSEDES